MSAQYLSIISSFVFLLPAWYAFASGFPLIGFIHAGLVLSSILHYAQTGFLVTGIDKALAYSAIIVNILYVFTRPLTMWSYLAVAVGIISVILFYVKVSDDAHALWHVLSALVTVLTIKAIL